MAITNAQQYQQLVNKPANGKRPGYRGIGGYQSGRSAPTSSSRSTSSRNTAGPGDTGGEGGNRPSDQSDTQSRAVDRSSDLQTINQLKNQNRYVAEDEDLLPGDTLTTEDIKLNKREQEFKDFLDRRNKVKLFGLGKIFTGPAQKFSDFNASINRPFFKDVIRAGKIPGLSFDATEEEFEKAYQEYMANRLSGKTDAYGNPVQGFSYNTEGDLVGNFIDNDGPDPIPFIPTDDNQDPTQPADPTQLLSSRILGSQFDPTFFAAEGGMAEENDPVGGIMDLESGRQMYFLGKLVKKVTRSVKKIAKSPIGKAAIGAALFKFGGGGGLGKFFGKGSLNPFLRKVAGDTAFSGLGSILSKAGLVSKAGLPTFTGGLALSTILPFLDKQKEDGFNLEEYYKTGETSGDVAPYNRIAGSEFDFYGSPKKDGGIMRAGYQEGGDAEPVAKKTMPLIDMDGKEKDYRETGGFVEMGRMERADDVPARLSKNEFVFTADAVRNAGEGDIDKGAEVMYNMMKNLESGGEVSEESQGLDGAREMFKTSQRLGEVI